MKKILIVALMSVFVITACEPLTDLNENVKDPVIVPPGPLFANSTIALFDFMTSTNVNVNNLRLWSQYWAQTTYPDESNYELVERNVNGRAWNTLYATVIRDVKEARTIIEADPIMVAEEKQVQSAIMEVVEVLTFHVLVDIFGDIPYTEALNINADATPAYDKDLSIYMDLINRLDAAINNLSGANSLGDYDLIYGGDTESWKKFANSLKLRMGIRVADYNNDLGKRMAEEATASGVFTSSSDDFEVAYQDTPPNTNPLWESLIQSGRSDFVAANTLVDVMNTLNDPRKYIYFKDNMTEQVIMGTDTTEVVALIGGIYGDANAYAGNSHPGAILEDPTFTGTIMDFTEVSFLLADAVERGYNVGGTAEEHYNAGITSSILEWGGSQSEADDYLAQADVAYSSASGTWKEKIAMQKWLAMYNRGFEGWSTYRMYDAPTMNVAAGAGTTPPYRYTYPITEFSLNGDNVQAAASSMGGDDLFSRIFWDMD